MKISANTKLANKGRLMRNGFKPYNNMKANLKKGAEAMIRLIKDSHKMGFNLMEQDMSTLGYNNQGYSNPYERWKQRYLSKAAGSYVRKGFQYSPKLRVNLELDGRFHNGLSLRFRGQTKGGRMSYSIVTVRPVGNRYKGTISNSNSYWKIVRQFETFDISQKNRNFLHRMLSNGYKSIASGIYSVK